MQDFERFYIDKSLKWLSQNIQCFFWNLMDQYFFAKIYTKVFLVDENIFHSFQTKKNKFLLHKIQHKKYVLSQWTRVNLNLNQNDYVPALVTRNKAPNLYVGPVSNLMARPDFYSTWPVIDIRHTTTLD